MRRVSLGERDLEYLMDLPLAVHLTRLAELLLPVVRMD